MGDSFANVNQGLLSGGRKKRESGLKKKCVGRAGFMTVCLLLFLSGCGHIGGDAKTDRKKLAFICKDLEHEWFQKEYDGMEAACGQYGMEISGFDADYDDARCMDYVRQVTEEGYDGLIICTTSQELGPEIGELCGEAEIPVLTVDDTMKDQDGKEFPHIGMGTRVLGSIGGSALANLAEEREFPTEDGKTGILEIDISDLSVFRERLDGYEESLFSKLDLKPEDVTVVEGSTGMYEDNYQKITEYFTVNPVDLDKYWIICGANDDCALAGVRALESLGIPKEHILACGLGGYNLSIREFESGNENYIAVMMQPEEAGEHAVSQLYEYLENGTPISSDTIFGGSIVTSNNYMLYYDEAAMK